MHVTHGKTGVLDRLALGILGPDAGDGGSPQR